jgi:CheY-like chemotaxis protein
MSAKKNEGVPTGAGAVLIADDNPDDVKLVSRDLQRLGLSHTIRSVSSGEQVISYLKGEGSYSDRDNFPYPVLLVLDLKMEPMDGFAVLRWLKVNPHYKTFPVLILTGWSERNLITEAYRLGATTFLTKPITVNSLKETFHALNVLPPRVD